MKNFSRNLLGQLSGKLPSSVREEDLRNLASSMKKSDFQDEAKLRQMIKALAAISGTSLTAEKEEKVIQMFRENKFASTDLQAVKDLLK